MRTNTDAPLSLAIWARSALLIFTSLDSRIITTWYPRASSSACTFWETASVSSHSLSPVETPVAPSSTFAFMVDAPGPMGSFSVLAFA